MKWLNINEKDFEVLRNSLANRQSPKGLSSALLFSIPLLWLMYYVVFHVAGEATIFPYIERMREGAFWFISILSITLFLFSFKLIYNRFHKTQYALSIVFSQLLFGVSPYMVVLFLMGEQNNITQESLLAFTNITLIFGLLIFVISIIRFIVLIRKGSYRAGTKKDHARAKMERTSYIGVAVMTGLSIFYTLQYLIRNSGGFGVLLEDGLILLLGLVLYYVMLFILPEQLVILYCKYRFKSFNFSSTSGRLYSIKR